MSNDRSSAKGLPQVLGVPCVRLSGEDFPAHGSAIFAGYATGVYDDPATTASTFIHTAGRLEPDARNHGIYLALAAECVLLLEDIKPHFDALAAIGARPSTDGPHQGWRNTWQNNLRAEWQL